jgi:RNA polymerase sigma-70 factor (ECF subfamily)
MGMDVRGVVVTERVGQGIEALYRSDGDRLWRAVLMYAGDPEVASDAVAEAFAQALRRGDAVRDPRRWVWRATFRIAAGELKERRRVVVSADEGYEHSELPLQLGMALAKLSPHQRAAVVLHHYVGYPVRDVARIIGSTASAVGVHLYRGRRRLRRLLEEGDG